MSIIWKRFLRLFFWNAVISLISSCIFWKLFGRDFNIHLGFLEIDFFNTIGVIFTIIGLGIALYQIAALRTEPEIKKETAEKIKIDVFKADALIQCSHLKKQLEILQTNMITQLYNTRETFNGYIAVLTLCINILDGLRINQNDLSCGTIMDCDNCLTLLSDLQNQFFDLAQKEGALMNRQFYSSKVRIIIGKVSECESNLKSYLYVSA